LLISIITQPSPISILFPYTTLFRSDNFNLTLVAGADGIHREILSNDISRPGFEMTGFFEYYPKERIQIIGKTEMNYFLRLSPEEQYDRARRLCTDVTPGIVVSNWLDIPDVLI